MPTLWTCAGGCGKTEQRPPTKALKAMCSPCRLATYKGDGNPNYKNASEKRCMLCGAHFDSYIKTRIYCSRRCYNLTRPAVPTRCPAPPKPKKPAYCPKPPRESAQRTTKCIHCKTEFTFYRSRPRLYCTYTCHVASGGAWRAGMASKKAVMKYGAKKDANHPEIVDALKAHGASVIDMSHVGQGFPDLIVGFRRETLLMEIKNPKTAYGKRGLNKNQTRWRDNWIGGPYAVVSSVDGALAAINALGTVATVTDAEGARRLLEVMRDK